MTKFRKKPVIIEASQWFKNGDHPLDKTGEEAFDPISNEYYKIIEGRVVRFYRHPGVSGKTKCKHCSQIMNNHGWIDTLEGGHNVCPGDWIITGVEGEHYPCKERIFKKTYEAIDG